jgi:hypothetical protein
MTHDELMNNRSKLTTNYIVHTLALTQRAQTQDKCNACIRSANFVYTVFALRAGKITIFEPKVVISPRVRNTNTVYSYFN